MADDSGNLCASLPSREEIIMAANELTRDALPATRPELHALVDMLPDTELAEAKRYLTGLNTLDNPALRAALLAPIDDEPLTKEELAAVEEAKREMARGEYVTMDDVKRELGLA